MSKKSAKSAPKEVSSYSPRDIVLGKIRGFPPWPGMVVDPDSVPEAVQHERPAKKTNFYCVQFFPTGDYAWLVPKDISRLQKHEAESYISEPYKRSGDLLQGYRYALDPATWEADRASAMAASAAAGDDEIEEDDGGEVDQLETDDEGKKKVKSRKRKRESDAVGTKPRKTAGAAKEKKEKPAKKATTSTRGRKSSVKSKSMIGVESEDDGVDAEGEDAGPSSKKAGTPPPTKRVRRDKEEDEDAKLNADSEATMVREWRHRLQKAFLSTKNQIPDEAEMPVLDELFTTVEAYHAITVAYLQFSKIGKVMRHITLLPAERIPRDDEFHFRDRAKALVERWQLVLGAAKGTENGSTPAVSGVNGSATKEAPKEVPKEEANVTTKDVKEPTEEKVNGADDANTKVVTAGAAAMDLNGTTENEGNGDVNTTVEGPTTDADASGDADADVSGQADAPGEAEDVAMAEA